VYTAQGLSNGHRIRERGGQRGVCEGGIDGNREAAEHPRRQWGAAGRTGPQLTEIYVIEDGPRNRATWGTRRPARLRGYVPGRSATFRAGRATIEEAIGDDEQGRGRTIVCPATRVGREGGEGGGKRDDTGVPKPGHDQHTRRRPQGASASLPAGSAAGHDGKAEHQRRLVDQAFVGPCPV